MVWLQPFVYSTVLSTKTSLCWDTVCRALENLMRKENSIPITMRVASSARTPNAHLHYVCAWGGFRFVWLEIVHRSAKGINDNVDNPRCFPHCLGVSNSSLTTWQWPLSALWQRSNAQLLFDAHDATSKVCQIVFLALIAFMSKILVLSLTESCLLLLLTSSLFVLWGWSQAWFWLKFGSLVFSSCSAVWSKQNIREEQFALTCKVRF